MTHVVYDVDIEIYVSAYKTVCGVNGPLVILDDVKVGHSGACSKLHKANCGTGLPLHGENREMVKNNFIHIKNM